jgi:hypothetical protein
VNNLREITFILSPGLKVSLQGQVTAHVTAHDTAHDTAQVTHQDTPHDTFQDTPQDGSRLVDGLSGSNAVMSSTMTGLKSGTCMGVLDYDFSGGIYFSLPLENDLIWLYDSPYVREPACLPVGKSAFGACGEPDSVYKFKKEKKINAMK